jgi:hypothetical protein
MNDCQLLKGPLSSCYTLSVTLELYFLRVLPCYSLWAPDYDGSFVLCCIVLQTRVVLHLVWTQLYHRPTATLKMWAQRTQNRMNTVYTRILQTHTHIYSKI